MYVRSFVRFMNGRRVSITSLFTFFIEIKVDLTDMFEKVILMQWHPFKVEYYFKWSPSDDSRTGFRTFKHEMFFYVRPNTEQRSSAKMKESHEKQKIGKTNYKIKWNKNGEMWSVKKWSCLINKPMARTNWTINVYTLLYKSVIICAGFFIYSFQTISFGIFF